MGVHSGKFGVVNGISTVRNWSVADTMTLSEAVASNTRFGKARRRAISDWSGAFSGYGGTPPIMPGELFTFEGFTAPDDDVSGNGVTYTGPSIVEQTTIVWNWETGEIINWTANFAGNGKLTPGTGTFSDETTPDLPEVCGRHFEYFDGAGTPGEYTEWTNLTQATLQISSANPTFVNSSSHDSGECWTGRRPGIIDWNLSVAEQDNVRTKFDKGDNLYLRLYVSETEFWELQWGRIREFTGLTIDVETGAIMSQTVNLDMNGVRDADGAIGTVILPDTSVWWPQSES